MLSNEYWYLKGYNIRRTQSNTIHIANPKNYYKTLRMHYDHKGFYSLCKAHRLREFNKGYKSNLVKLQIERI